MQTNTDLLKIGPRKLVPEKQIYVKIQSYMFKSLSPSGAIGSYIWVNVSSGYDLLSEDAKPLPEPTLTYHVKCSVTFIENNFMRRKHELNL